MIEDFGIIIACCDQDYIFAKGCCASIRYFLGDVPICLIVDGTFSLLPLERTYGVKVINSQNIGSQVLKKRSFGFGLTKMIAFWESPWKNFLFIDADTIVWGDILKFANYKEFDVITDKPRYKQTDRHINSYFFDLKKIEQHFPNFRWQNYQNYYFNSGVFFAKRDIFSIDEYLDILELTYQDPKMFYPGEQGVLNFMICRAAEEGRIRLGQNHLQLMVPNQKQTSLKQRLLFENNQPVINNEDVVIHWCGRNKPISITTKVYSEPMNFSRRKFIEDTAGYSQVNADLQIKIEDYQHLLYVYKNKFKNKFRNNIQRVKFRN